MVVDSFDTPGERAQKGRLVVVDLSRGTLGERESAPLFPVAEISSF